MTITITFDLDPEEYGLGPDPQPKDIVRVVNMMAEGQIDWPWKSEGDYPAVHILEEEGVGREAVPGE